MAKDSWSFFRAGGVDQVVLKSGSDIANLRSLDQKLWVALACPVKGTEIDDKTLALIDSDKDGRVRANEVLETIDWCTRVFKSLDPLLNGSDKVSLSSLNEKTDDGKAVISSAKRILVERNKKDAKDISIDDVVAMTDLFVKTRFNGDGIVPSESSDDEQVQKAIADIIVAVGSQTDRSGLAGVDKASVEKFFEQAEELVTWQSAGAGEDVRALGDKTEAAGEALSTVEAKIVDFFSRCRIAAFDSRGAALLGASEAELTNLASRSLSPDDGEVAKLPLGRIEANRALTLESGVNPAWAVRLATFSKACVAPVLGVRSTISESDFHAIVAKLAPYREWLAKKPGGDITKLDAARVSEIVASGVKAKILDLIAKDAELEGDFAQIGAVEKAVRLHRDLALFLRNFVNFADFYGRKGASFQAGTLYLDARACDLAVMVNDAGKHASLASLSKAYLAYCDCTRAGHDKMSIVAVFSDGDVDNLMVGRNGVFYDRKGQDWDATITSIVDNPISVRQAFWAPYKKLIRTIEEMVAKRAAEKEKQSSSSIDAAAAAAATADKTAPAPAGAPAPEPPKKMDIGTVAAIGVAVGGVGAFLASVFGMFFGLGIWMPVGILGIILAISGPSMLIAWLKLRQRNMGPILDANGWAINSQVKINVPFGRSLTSVASLPEGAQRGLGDPYAEKKTPWGTYIFLLLIVVAAGLWLTGKIDSYLPEKAHFSNLIKGAPPSVAPAPSAVPSADAPK